MYPQTTRQAARPLLGTMPDREVAECLSVPERTVRSWRTQRGIAPYRLHARRPCRQGALVYLAILRQCPRGLTQSRLAKLAGVTRQAAHQMCHRMVAMGRVVCEQQALSPDCPWVGRPVTRYRLIEKARP